MSARPVTETDLPRIVEIHQAAFPGFLMTLLGPVFLDRYYRLVLHDPGAIFLGVDEAGQVAGFVAGFSDPQAFYHRLRGNRLRMLAAAAFHLVLRPHLWARVLEATRSGGAGDAEGEAKVAELASIAVHPLGQGKGHGASLVRAFLQAAGTRGARQVVLTTDAAENEAVNRLYRNAGFELVRMSARTNGRVMNHYRRFILKGLDQ